MSLLLLFNQSLYARFLDTADHMLAVNPGAAVVFAHTACEILAEQVLAAAFAYRKVPELEGPVTDLLLRNSNLGNPRVRKIYEALTNDPIGQASFWSRFKASVDLRNDVVHRGRAVSLAEGEASCAVARECAAHLIAVWRSF